MPKRIRRDHGNTELRGAKVLRARKEYGCVWCVTQLAGGSTLTDIIAPNEVYARLSGVRTSVCSAHFTLADIVETDK
jgi:hypothetical protein